MKFPTLSQTEGAAARRVAPDFGLTSRALAFAKLYAENPRLGATQCAKQAGYASRCVHGAHVRAYELLRDRRVIRAIIYFSGKALNEARAEAIQHLTHIAAREGRFWRGWDRRAFDRLVAGLTRLETHTERVEKIYESGLFRAL
ncbi:MAG: hypothetical protein P4M13_06215 [Alphaproteobacteria bacterium]|nr:hypothetical protein [Alphaproteobacteria bacterium]